MSRCVPIQTNVNTAEPFFALAGDAAQVSANPSFSSITFPPAGGGIGAINMSSLLFFNGNTTSFVFQPDNDAFGSPRNIMGFRAPNTIGTQMLLSQDDNTISRIDCADGTGISGSGQLYINALTSISSLTVSSINGATPGTGGTLPANAAFSSITITAAPSSIINNLYTKNLTTTTAITTPSLITTGFTSVSSLTVSSINGTGSALINPTQCGYHLQTGSGNNWNTVTFAKPFPAGESVVVVASPNVTNGATPTQYPLTRNETVVQFEVFGTAGTGINWIASSVV